jgi:DNA-binding response OmpR family regulator
MKIISADDNHERILIVEDHTRTREALRALFERKSYHIIETGKSREAIAILSAPDGPSVAIVDWMLPDGSGLDICQAVRKKDFGRSIYLIMITGRSEGEEIAQALAAGADDFIHKPCDVVELMARVRNGLRRLELERGLRKRIAELEAAS